MVTTVSGAELREVREAANVSIDELAERIGFPPTMISRVERDKRAPPDGFADAHLDAVRQIARERAAAVGA